MSSPKGQKQQNEELERKLGNMTWLHDESQDQLRSIANDTCSDTMTLVDGGFSSGFSSFSDSSNSFHQYVAAVAAALRTNKCLSRLDATRCRWMDTDHARTIATGIPSYRNITVVFKNPEAQMLFDSSMTRRQLTATQDMLLQLLRVQDSQPKTETQRVIQKLQQLEDQVQRWQAENQCLPAEKQLLETAGTSLRTQMSQLRESVEHLQQQLQLGGSERQDGQSKLQSKIHQLENENGKLQQKEKELKEVIRHLNSEQVQLHNKAQNVQEQLRVQKEEWAGERGRWQEEEEKLRDQVQQLREYLQAREKEWTLEREELAKHSADLKNAVQHLRHKSAVKEDWENQVERLLNLNVSPSSLVNKVVVTNAKGKPLSGASGHLFKATFAGHPVALKQIVVTNPPRFLDVLSCRAGGDDVPDHVKQLRREALILLSMRHPNIVPFLGLSYDDNAKTLCFVLSWAEGGSLHDHLHVRRLSPDKATALRILLEVASALAFMHAHNIVHRDLKSPNILLDGALSAKVTDFGLSTFREADKSVVSKVAGTELWASPEQLLNQILRFDTDVYSFGVIMWEVLLHCKPWHHGQYAGTGANLAVLILAFNSGRYLPLEDTINGKVLQEPERELLRGCFASQGSRLTFSQLQDALTAQHKAAAETEALNEQEQTVLLHGPADAKWKFDASFLHKVEARMVTLTARPSARIAPLDLSDSDSQTIVKQLMADAGGRTAEESDLLAPFGRAVAGAAITQCSQKNAAFTGAVSRNKTRLRGHLSTKTHLFAPKYTCDASNGQPANPEECAVLSRVTLFPADGGGSSSGLHTYKVLDDAMLKGDPHLRLQRVFHGVRSFDAVTGILGGDFATLQKLDGGWYGAGFYFTPDLDYALAYAAPCSVPSASSLPAELQGLGLPAGKQYRIVLACDVQYGNPYPVLDHTTHSGQALQAGHDAHVTVIDFSSGGIGGAKPLKSSQWGSKRTAAEIVISDPSCVLVRGVLVFKA